MQDITDSIIKAIEDGEIDGKWERPWNAAQCVPTNPWSKDGKGHDFTGLNALWLYLSFGGGYFGTYKQWKNGKAQVRKGSKAIAVLKPLFTKEEYTKLDGTTSKRDKLVNFASYNVFHSDDVDGWEPPKVETIEFTPNQLAERLIAACGAVVEHGGTSALYIPSQDRVRMPAHETFHSEEKYYAVMMHELAHWTGHKTRLDREQNTSRFAHNAYAFEELIAETAATFVCARLGINQGQFIDPNHVKYVKHWLEIMKGDSKALSLACSKGQAAANYLMEFLIDDKQEEAA